MVSLNTANLKVSKMKESFNKLWTVSKNNWMNIKVKLVFKDNKGSNCSIRILKYIYNLRYAWAKKM